MEILIRYKVDLKDEKLCLGCPFSYVKKEGSEMFGEWCRCSSEDRCGCSPPRWHRDKDKDEWHCKIFDLSLGIGQIPHRNEECNVVNQMENEKLKQAKKSAAGTHHSPSLCYIWL